MVSPLPALSPHSCCQGNSAGGRVCAVPAAPRAVQRGSQRLLPSPPSRPARGITAALEMSQTSPLPSSIRDAGGLHRQPDLFQRGCADTGRIPAAPCSGVTHGLWFVGDLWGVSGAGAEPAQLCQVLASPSLGGKNSPLTSASLDVN